MINLKKASIIGGTVAMFGAGAYAGFLKTDVPEAKAASGPEVVAVQRQDLNLQAEASGTVEPVRTVEVKSKASGEVLKIYVETGDHVEAGALLAEIDPRDVQNALDQAAADLESARVQQSTTTANRSRMEQLKKIDAVTQQEYESAVQSAAAARASVVRAETNLQLAQQRRNDVTIRAPITGTIIERAVEPGQIIASATSNVSGGTTLFKMADLSRIQVRTLVDETDVGQVQPGQAAQVTVEAYSGRTFRGTVQKIEPLAVVDQNVTTFPVLVTLPNPGELLKPGMNAEVAVQIASRPNAVVVPNTAVVGMRDLASAATALGLDADSVRSALRPAGARQATPTGHAQGGQQGQQGHQQGGYHPGVVFVQGAKGPEARRVTLGLSDWENTEIVQGVKPGERVVQVSAAQLKQKQQDAADRMRQRAGGGMFGGAPGGGAQGSGGGRTGG